ncbi:YopX family protein [Levilactobacillus brevis]|uniref:YopX family protein n=1 Tax=Levilactobacillus brevis TaxID=1580 RepID=UPI000BE86F73|nr:YopX family protein [Levilactobacillus brevis]MCZ2118612.1 YopX family protein [Levilactobacillus brevis]MCZ2124204.1 YopX family protein [Levilactobacillus brevis]MCZ2208524.1 YopX family protein [Levilactobacillus brevis]MCZ2323988.1 YopX family protein [Levilactobacillus brevis]
MVPKFRAWNGYRKIMADYVSAIQNGDTQGTPSSVNVIVNGKNETWDIENDHVELLQYTGLKDANGKEIYEGDILATSSKIGGKLIADYLKVDWREDYAGFFCGETPLYACLSEWNNDIKYPQTFPEIVGNVYGSPELLEDKK